MAEDTDLNDVISEQTKTINTLITNLQDSKTADNGQRQPIYNSTPQKTAEKTPNYAIWIGLAIFGFIILKKGKLL